jgi:WD40 repeat protein
MKPVARCFLIGMLLLVSGQSVTAQELTHDSVYQVAWNPVENQIAFADYNGLVYVWDITTGQVVWTFAEQRRPDTPKGVASAYITHLQWNTDGTLLAANASGGNTSTAITIWNTDTGQLVQTIEEPDGGSLALDWIPNTAYLLTGMDGIVAPEIRLWDTTTGTLATTYDISAAAFFRSPTNNLLGVVPSYWIDLRDPTTLDLVKRLRLETDCEQSYMVDAVAWSSDGSRLAAGYINGIIRLWNIDTAAVVQTFKANDRPYINRGVSLSAVLALNFSPDDTLLSSISRDGTLRQWDVNTGDMTHDQQLGAPVITAVWSPYGARLVVSVTPDAPLTQYTVASRGGLRVIVPDASIDRFRSTARRCLDTLQIEYPETDTLTPANIPDWIAALNAEIQDARSYTCAADLLALAEAIQDLD